MVVMVMLVLSAALLRFDCFVVVRDHEGAGGVSGALSPFTSPTMSPSSPVLGAISPQPAASSFTLADAGRVDGAGMLTPPPEWADGAGGLGTGVVVATLRVRAKFNTRNEVRARASGGWSLFGLPQWSGRVDAAAVLVAVVAVWMQ